jgi:hypothetical protein
VEPLAVRPKDAFAAIGVGVTKGYELIGSGELQTIKIGRGTRILVSSINDLVARRIADQREPA